jgi:microcystin-dependent protein
MDEMLAIVKLFAGTYTPIGYMDCNGQTLPVSHYQALYSLLGNNYGGNGVQSFNLPDLRPVGPDGKKRPWNANEPRSIICVEGLYPQRD